MEVITRRDLVKNSAVAAAAVAAGTAVPAAASDSTNAGGAVGRMKIIAICCSPRKGKSTAACLRICLDAAKEVSRKIDVELIELAGKQIPGSLAAGVPLEPGQKDDFPKLGPRLSDPSVAGIIIGTPVYFGNMSSLCKAFLDRCIVLWQDNLALGNKVAGVLAVGGSRNGGQELTIQSVHTSLLCQQMIVVGNGQPGPRLGGTVWSGANGGATGDEFGMATVRSLGRRVAEVALRLSGIVA